MRILYVCTLCRTNACEGGIGTSMAGSSSETRLFLSCAHHASSTCPLHACTHTHTHTSSCPLLTRRRISTATHAIPPITSITRAGRRARVVRQLVLLAHDGQHRRPRRPTRLGLQHFKSPTALLRLLRFLPTVHAGTPSNWPVACAGRGVRAWSAQQPVDASCRAFPLVSSIEPTQYKVRHEGEVEKR